MKNESEHKRDIYHIHDKSYKDLYSKKEIAADLFKSMIDAKWTEYIKPENLTLVNKSYVTSDYEETEADIVYKTRLMIMKYFFIYFLNFNLQLIIECHLDCK